MNSELNKQDKEQIRQSFIKIYNSLATLNYCKGGTIGRAQQKALDQMSAFVRNKTKTDNPFNEYLKQLDSDNRKTMSEYIMKSRFSDDVFNDAVAAQRWGKMANTELKFSLGNFNKVYKKYQTTGIEEERQQLMQNILNLVRDKKWLSK